MPILYAKNKKTLATSSTESMHFKRNIILKKYLSSNLGFNLFFITTFNMLIIRSEELW